MRTKALLLFVVLIASCDDPMSPRHLNGGKAAAARPAPLTIALTATSVSSSGIDLAWQDNASNETGWEIHQSPTADGQYGQGAEVGSNVTHYSATGLIAQSQHCYKVRSYTYSKKGVLSVGTFSNVACAVTLTAPPPPRPNAPGIVDVTAVGSTAVRVDWYYVSNTVRVERSTDAGVTWTAVGTAQGPQQYYVDTALVAEQRVCYRLIASNDVAESLPSNVDCTTPPAAPSNITYEILDDTSYVVRWSDNSAVETGYEINVFGYRWNEYFGSCYDEIGAYLRLPANATSVILNRSAGFGGIVAYSDGGRSNYDFTRIELNPPPGPLCWGDSPQKR